MADILKRDFDIAVLKVEVVDGDDASAGPRVRFTLQYHEQGELHDGAVWNFALSDVVPSRLDRSASRGGPDAALPAELLGGVADWFLVNGAGERPLWVHLVKPYGSLRVVAWERVLGAALERPILMLPDFIFPPPREAVQSLDVVLCGSAPLGVEDHSVREALRQAADRILAAGSRPVRVHVFADRDMADSLAAEWRADGRLGTQILVHDHALAEPYVSDDVSSRLVDEAGTLRSPWLLWMRAALAGNGVDVVHFVCHGHLARDRGAMLFAQSPLGRSDTFLAGPVGSSELGTFLTQTGAWSTVFTSLPDNHSEPGLRSLADEIAQSRPGPMMMHVLREDPGAQALTDGYAFLYSLEAHPPPRSLALFMYCQPYLAAARAVPAHPKGLVERGAPAPLAPSFAARGMPAAAALGAIARNGIQAFAAGRSVAASPLDPLFADSERVSTLVASTERFAEQVQLRYQQMARDDLMPHGSASVDEAQVTFATLDKLREAVAELESPVVANGAAA